MNRFDQIILYSLFAISLFLLFAIPLLIEYSANIKIKSLEESKIAITAFHSKTQNRCVGNPDEKIDFTMIFAVENICNLGSNDVQYKKFENMLKQGIDPAPNCHWCGQ